MIGDREWRVSRPTGTEAVASGHPDLAVPTPHSGHRRSGPFSLRHPPGAADRRGLPVSGAVALALGAGIGGGAIDVLTGQGLRSVFAVTFVLGCGLAAALVRRTGLLATVVMPPLIYVVLALCAAAVQPEGATNSWLLRQVFELMTALILGAPTLFTATALSAVIAALRLVAARHAPGEPDVVNLPGQ